jgi:probable HAF family extracellular repeat protein
MLSKPICSCAVVVVAVGALASTTLAQWQFGFHPLPSLVSNYPAYVEGLSGDGSTALGQADPVPPGSAGTNAVAWRSTGIQDFGRLGGFDACAFGSSHDGSVAVGYSDLSGPQSVPVRFAGGQITQLVPWPTGYIATSCSADASVIAGLGQYGSGAWRWTESGTQSLAALAGFPRTQAFGVSANGQVIAGSSNVDDGSLNPGRAVIWTNGGAPTELQMPATLSHRTTARDISPDGSAIVGSGMDPFNLQHAVLWLNGAPMDLGALPSSVPGEKGMSRAHAVSANGAVVGGMSGHTGSTVGVIHDPAAFLWTPQTGMVDLKQYLESQWSMNLTGWWLYDVTGISDDGRVIVGNGRDPTGLGHPWVAVIPAPGGLLLMASLFACGRRRPSESPSRSRRLSVTTPSSSTH